LTSDLPRRGSAEWPVVPRDAALLSSPRASAKRLARYAHSANRGRYPESELESIIATYAAACEEAGLDPLLVVSQLLLETQNLTAASARLPHLDPVGMLAPRRGQAGPGFPSWAEAARAHAGLLLAYALPEGAGNDAQRRLLELARGRRPVPGKLRGSAPTLDRLAGAWSADKGYPERIREIANEILTPQY
jgi:hypothetical protein